MTSFLVLKPGYPHEAASNSLFSIKKGEIIECPPGYKPGSSFQICETREAAEQYIKLAYLTSPPKTFTEKRGSSSRYPLFRKVSSPDGQVSYQLFARDVHRFLSQREEDVIISLREISIHRNTAKRLLDYESKHFSRQNVIEALKSCIGAQKEKKGAKL